MNPTTASLRARRPALVCRVVRRWCAIFSDHRPAHVRSCPHCQEYFQAEESLSRSLRNDALVLNRDSAPFAPDLERQIVHAVRLEALKDQRGAPGSVPAARGWLAGAIGATAVVAFGLWLGREQPANQPTPTASFSQAEDAALIVKTVESLSTELVVSVIPTAGELVAQNPLQRELGAVYSDVRSALDFLALNFLPATRVEPPSERARRI